MPPLPHLQGPVTWVVGTAVLPESVVVDEQLVVGSEVHTPPCHGLAIDVPAQKVWRRCVKSVARTCRPPPMTNKPSSNVYTFLNRSLYAALQLLRKAKHRSARACYTRLPAPLVKRLFVSPSHANAAPSLSFEPSVMPSPLIQTFAMPLPLRNAITSQPTLRNATTSHLGPAKLCLTNLSPASAFGSVRREVGLLALMSMRLDSTGFTHSCSSGSAYVGWPEGFRV